MSYKVFLIGIFLTTIVGCKDSNTYKQMGGVKYITGDNNCSEEDKPYWLVDLELKNENDSVFLNTKTLGRKIEIHKKQTDTSSSLQQLISSVCVNDSASFILNADSFYNALGGKAPLNLNKNKPIHVKLWMRDKLSDIEFLAHKQVFENEGVNRFIKKAGWNGQLDSNTLIYFEKLKISQEPKVGFKKAKLKYVIKSLNENVIAFSKEEDPLIYDVSDKSILRGIQFLSKKLAEGESLRAIVPSPYAYGADGNSKVPGYMPILIELELVEIIE